MKDDPMELVVQSQPKPKKMKLTGYAAVNIRDEGMRIFTEGHSESACGGR